MPRETYSVKRVKVKGPDAHAKTTDLVKLQEGLRKSVAESPHFNDDPEIGTTFDKWTAVADQLAAADVTLDQILGLVKPARTAVGRLRAQYMTAAQTFYGVLQNRYFDDGPAVQSFGVQLQSGPGPAPAPTAPAKLRVVMVEKQPGHFVARWHLVRGAGLYELQRSLDGRTYETVYTGKSAEYAGTAFVGQYLWFQVRAHGDTTSAWSQPLQVLVR
jgi:hypothetical protein